MKHLHEVGQRIAEGLGEGPDDSTVADQRRRFLTSLDSSPSRRWLPIFAATGALAAAAVAIFVVFAVPQADDSMEFWVGDATTMARAGESLRAADDAQLPVNFADGSEVVISASSRGVIERASEEEISVSLTRGRLHARVVSARDRVWTFSAGPYEVRVTGTRLAIDWRAGLFEVEVQKGGVQVFGPSLPKNGLRVHKDQVLRAGDGIDEPAVQSLQPIEAETEQPQPEQASKDSLAHDFRKPTTKRSKPGPARWKTLAGRGEYAEALDAARAHGLKQVLREANASELALLADAARFAREGALARQILQRLTKRFPGSKQGRLVPFLLGRICLDIDNNPAAAAPHLQRYLDKQPRGELAEQALGRLIAVRKQLGQDDRARAAAKKYLEKHPKGSYARLATSLLRE